MVDFSDSPMEQLESMPAGSTDVRITLKSGSAPLHFVCRIVGTNG